MQNLLDKYRSQIREKKLVELIQLARNKIMYLQSRREKLIKKSINSFQKKKLLQRVQEQSRRQKIQAQKKRQVFNQPKIQYCKPQPRKIRTKKSQETFSQAYRKYFHAQIQKFQQAELHKKQSLRKKILLQEQYSRLAIRSFWRVKKESQSLNRERSSKEVDERLVSLEQTVLIPFKNRERQLRLSLSILKKGRLGKSIAQ